MNSVMDIKVEQVTPSSPLTSQSISASNTSPTAPRPQYFVSRADGTLTPLIAVDELPSSVRIMGVPAVISQAGTINMMSLGVKERSQSQYIVEISNSSTGDISKNSTSAESIPRILEKQIPALEPAVQKADIGVKDVEEWRNGVKSEVETQATIDAVIAANDKLGVTPTSGTPNAATPGTFGKKVYCTHWIRWGECDYMQQGCLYKHEMPDEETLIAIGIRTIPKWYRDINAPKNGWTERPAPADQIWRGKPSTRAQPEKQIQTFYPLQSAGPMSPFEMPLQPAPASRNTTGISGYESSIYPNFSAPKPKYFGHGIKKAEPRSRPASTSLPYSFLNNNDNNNNAASSAPLTPAQQSSNLYPFTSPTLSSVTGLPTSLAPSHRSLLPFLAAAPALHSPPPPFPEIKTPVPRHRRLFVAAGEPKYVSNSSPTTSKEGKQKHTRREKVAMGSERRGGVGLERGKTGVEFGRNKGVEELLVDI